MENDSFQRWARGECPLDEARIWDGWIQQSEEHRVRAMEAQKRILGLGFEKNARLMALESWKSLERQIAMPGQQKENSRSEAFSSNVYVPYTGRNSGVSWAARVAVFAVMLLTGGILWSYLADQRTDGGYFGMEELLYQSVETGFGEQKELRLTDGSYIILNANSSLRYGRSVSNSNRVDIELEGEAYFSIPSRGHSNFHDRDDLFQVFTKDGVVRVLGTRFAVSSHDNRTVVVLEEGSVAIAAADSEGEISGDISQHWILQPDELAEFRLDSGGLIRKETVNTRVYTSWKDPRLYFENVTVREVIKRFEQTFGIPFSVSDEALLDRTVSGSVENSELAVMARIFAEILDVTVEVSDEHVHIRNS